MLTRDKFCSLPVSAWCSQKGHTYLNEPAAESSSLSKYEWPFSGYHALKG